MSCDNRPILSCINDVKITQLLILYLNQPFTVSEHLTPTAQYISSFNPCRHTTYFLHLYFSQMHCWDDGTPLEETMRALNDLVRSGKVHYIGVSNVVGWQFQRIVDMSRELGLERIVSNQVGEVKWSCDSACLCCYTAWY